jgi:DNA-binding transcriptional regulator YhcF (GntR family)
MGGKSMIDIHIDDSAQTPLYEQLVERVKQLIATNQVKPGERLPTVRQLAQSLHVNPGTVARAYRELEQEGMVTSRRGGGTIVSARGDDSRLLLMRQTRLSSMMSNNILEALSLGYSPEELEAAFSLHLSRWREERKGTGGTVGERSKRVDRRNTLVIVASHDLALTLLVSRMKEKDPDTGVEITHAGSLGGLIALQEERADLAGIHLLDEESGQYNYPYVKHILPGREMAIVNLAYRIQGLLFAKDNPKQIKGIEDIKRTDVTIVNRQKGSGTRVLLDLKLREHGILPSDIRG